MTLDVWRVPTVLGVMACSALVLFASAVIVSIVSRRASSRWPTTVLTALGCLVIGEVRHELNEEDGERASDYEFVLRWSDRAEIEALLARHGFGKVAWFGAYDPDVPIGSSDRLVVIAQRCDATASDRLPPIESRP